MQGVLDWAEVNPNQKQNVKKCGYTTFNMKKMERGS